MVIEGRARGSMLASVNVALQLSVQDTHWAGLRALLFFNFFPPKMKNLIVPKCSRSCRDTERSWKSLGSLVPPSCCFHLMAKSWGVSVCHIKWSRFVTSAWDSPDCLGGWLEEIWFQIPNIIEEIPLFIRGCMVVPLEQDLKGIGTWGFFCQDGCCSQILFGCHTN